MKKNVSRVIPNPCDECVCSYCIWRGTDNCLRCEYGSCLRCGESRRARYPIYECVGYTMPPPGMKTCGRP